MCDVKSGISVLQQKLPVSFVSFGGCGFKSNSTLVAKKLNNCEDFISAAKSFFADVCCCCYKIHISSSEYTYK